jgi:hypothetical protein
MSIAKRQKEKKRQDKQRDKDAKRAQRRTDRDGKPEREPGEEDPDLAGIVPGPQPLPEEWE